jgi:flagellar biosynthesis protein FlhF
MNARKFTGSNSRQALQAVKRELGADAIILANHAVEGGVEITAIASAMLRVAEGSDAGGDARGAGPLPVRPAVGEAGSPVRQASMDGVVSEIGALRKVLEDHLGGLVWGDLQRREPVQARLLRDLLRAGFGPGLARFVTENLPADTDAAEGLRWVQAALARNLRCAQDDDIVMRGGVYALLGPTGVGKTTTTAKLAARCVVRHGAERLALLTTDSYRIGAHEHLRIYGRILGVPVHAVSDVEDLRAILADLAAKHTVLIDTVGMSQRDKMVTEQVGMLCGAGRPVNRLLLLGACSGADVLDETVRAYRGTDDGIAGVILTKIDEAVSLGGALDVIIRHRLQLHYVSNGQRVPEDLHTPKRDYLLHRALRPAAADAPFALVDEDVPALLGGPHAPRSGLGALVRA